MSSSQTHQTRDIPLPPLSGGMLIGAALLLAAANFVAVLDTTIANVSVPTISGALGASSSQGTYVITSYAVAEAITVPLTGWLANRFGTVRVFITSLIMFGLCSALCGMATSLEMLVLFRVFQGLAGGPLMPLSQTLLLRIFPKEKAAAAIGLWSMTTLVAPVLGPILGGVICDRMHWAYIFYINVPVALICGYLGWRLLKRYETSLMRVPIDAIGLALLVVWVGALQILLDEGKDHDWFASTEIRVLAIIAAIGFASFLIWELTDRHPVVDLRVFRHRGFSASVITITLAFGAFFGATVLTPLWLQSYMGYTATWAGCATAMTGILAVLSAPLAANLSSRFDGRWLVFAGVMWLGAVTLWRTHANTDMTFWQVALPLLLQGVGLPFFFVPLTGLALSSVEEPETASAAGLMNFCRTFGGAIATSLVNTGWEDRTKYDRAELSGLVDQAGHFSTMLTNSGWSAGQAQAQISDVVQSQAVMLATNQLFTIAGACFIFAALAVWLAPKPTRVADTSQAH
ncbi:DHA2 family efflux MFS transporter permease subunit [Paraburkholderia terricola]|uniref:DHA2 family multidrug resistance protein n=1 Tax=Paraburkholderia terricola TaxID=169427 RepID=A0ABU1LKJ2_9BURK|nr:DHA2 family efflux MFS transporter permease subunit [Paraburkholderia terricola]MDR6407040.1 DHA2 family multidrug resistance protein [Paraburkholderia terricola]MDR6479281.1 DHA2 family multidrug resistance protein [Paraburkholderia terricola]